MANEINGWGTFALSAGPTLDVINFTAGEVILDDSVETQSNSNGDASGGVKSKEPGHFKEYGPDTIKVKHSAEAKIASIAQLGVKDTATLTRQSGAATASTGWILSYVEDENSPASAPEATVMWENYTGVKGEAPPVETPAT